MGLASSLSTALTGLNAAETMIDVAGNNIANANTIGFKESSVQFANQFLQITQGLGSSPTSNSGGKRTPEQTGLGVEVSEISPDSQSGHHSGHFESQRSGDSRRRVFHRTR